MKRESRHIESKYNHKDKSKGEFISFKFVPPGRILIYKGTPEEARYLQPITSRSNKITKTCEIWSPRWQKASFNAIPANLERKLEQ